MSFQLRYDMGSFGNSIRRGHRLAVEGELGWCRGLIGAVRGAGTSLRVHECYGYTGATGARVLLDSSYELDVAGVVRSDVAEVVL